LQLLKSVVIPVKPSQRKKDIKDTQILLNENKMPVVDKSAHLGILRSTSCKATESETTDWNITKARRVAYRLMVKMDWIRLHQYTLLGLSSNQS
jgi:hypothetical protein